VATTADDDELCLCRGVDESGENGRHEDGGTHLDVGCVVRGSKECLRGREDGVSIGSEPIVDRGSSRPVEQGVDRRCDDVDQCDGCGAQRTLASGPLDRGVGMGRAVHGHDDRFGLHVRVSAMPWGGVLHGWRRWTEPGPGEANASVTGSGNSTGSATSPRRSRRALRNA
jgi:hypothetical protein